MLPIQEPFLDMTNFPELAVGYVHEGDYAGAIDVFILLKMVPPQALLNAWSAKMSAMSKTGHIYSAEMRDGRVRLMIQVPGKPAPATED